MPGKLSSAFKNLFCLTSATACSAAPAVYAAMATADPKIGVLAGVALGGVSVADSLFKGEVGEIWNELRAERLADPRSVLRNEALLQLSGDAVSASLRAEAKRRAGTGQREISERIEILAGKLVEDWLQLAETDDWSEHLKALSQEDIQERMSKSGIDWSESSSLNQATWLSILTSVATEYEVNLSTPLLQELATRLCDGYAMTVRKLLTQDAEDGGEAFAGLLLNLHADTVHSLAALTSGQEKLQTVLTETGTDVRSAVTMLLESGNAITTIAESIVERHEQYFQRN